MQRSLPLAFLLIPAALQAQLTITDGLTPVQITGLLEGFNISISNLTINCADSAFGQFNGASEIPIANGLVLTSGLATSVAGPVGSFASGVTSMAGDPDLAGLVGGGPTYDACVLEFDCVPLGDTLLFNFAFGSEEYPEFVGSAFNDVFAIWLTGPGYPIPTNVAAIPGGTPVSINNVNAGVNATYYVDNEAIPGVYCAYDGFTQNLTAFAVVTPGATYHFKTAIADVADGAFDSGVFLEAFSFRSVMGPTALGEQASGDGSIVRDQSGTLIITLPEGRTNMQGRLIDAMGRIASRFRVSGSTTSVSTTGLRSGHYTMELTDGQGSLRRSFYFNADR